MCLRLHLKFKVYTGQDQDKTDDRPASSKVVLDLANDLLGLGYNIFIDNWYSSPELFYELKQHNTNVCGTVRLNRRNMPADLRNIRLQKGDIAIRSGEGILCLVWKDKKDVKILSTMHTALMVDTGNKDRQNNAIIKPQCVLDYNKGMGGTDLSDQLATTCKSVRKHIKWYKKLFYYLLDMAIINSYLLRKTLGGRMSVVQFKMSLIHEIVDATPLPEYRSRGRPRSLPVPGRMQGNHFPELIPATEKKVRPTKRCHVCAKRGVRAESRYMCDKCGNALCVHPCFKEFHLKNEC
ncbi:hypothetical protein SNE40_007943 [Patella caerulea]|uniref:PiggyBac transposable element-derived protein 4 n=1 Tax=Patella caerulea TaxID=87958 RepID=A0AAN8Q981_PATCE